MFFVWVGAREIVGHLQIADITNGVMGQRQRFGQRDLKTAAGAGAGMPAIHNDFVEG